MPNCPYKPRRRRSRRMGSMRRRRGRRRREEEEETEGRGGERREEEGEGRRRRRGGWRRVRRYQPTTINAHIHTNIFIQVQFISVLKHTTIHTHACTFC